MPHDEMKQHTRTILLLTEFDGGCFHGWQQQENAVSVQGTLQDVWRTHFQEDISLLGSSRTDAGVHARGHVSQFRTQSSIPASRIPYALNSRLPAGISVLAAREVSDDFHARYGARSKWYTYRIANQAVRPAIDRRTVVHVPGRLDLSRIRAGLPLLTGTHNFTAFMDQGSVLRRPVRDLYRLSLQAEGGLLKFNVVGSGFLYHMVRILIGTLVAIGQGKLSPEDIPRIIQSGNRKYAGKTMPAHGLCLERVYYDVPVFGHDRWQEEVTG